MVEPGSDTTCCADRRCRPWSLDNALRRRFAPPGPELGRLSPGPGMAVADMGAGVGYFAPTLLARIGPHGRLYLVDPDAENLEIARRSVGERPNVTYVVGSAAHADRIPTGSLDRVLCSLVLCCLVDKVGAMDEIWRVLRPGGEALITYPKSGGSPFRRKRTLRVSPEIWEGLRARRPWTVVSSRRGWLVTRHLLRKP